MNTNRDARELASDLLERSTCKVQVAAVISNSHGIFSWGWNHCGPKGEGMHAEHHAISRCRNRRRLRGAKLTVIGRRKKNKNLVLSRPCKEKSRKDNTSCMEIAKSYGISVIEYMTKSGTWQTLELVYVPTRE